MNTRNSIYDSLNAGRNRRPGTTSQSSSLQDLEATIGGIEERLQRMNARSAAPTNRYADEISERMRKLSNDVASPARQQEARRPMADPYETPADLGRLTRQVERARQEEASAGSMNAIMNEINQLRSEIRHLPQTSNDDWGMALRNEIEAIKSGLGNLAREDTLRSVESRWDQYAKRPAANFAEDPAIGALLSRIEDLQGSISSLPQSFSLTSLEEKIRILASAIDQMSRRSPEFNGSQLIQIEDRLDEISRAIVASSVSVQPIGQDNASFDRIESRLGNLNARIDDLLNMKPDQSVHERINVLAAQVDLLASKSGAPMEQMVRMASQMEIIASKLTNIDNDKVDPNTIASGLEDRLFEIAARLEQSNKDAGRENNAILAELEARLEELSSRIHSADQTPNHYPEQILTAVEQRFSDLSRQLMANQVEQSVDPVFASNIERRFDELTKRLNETGSHLTGQDPTAIARLESQVQNLSKQLSQPQAPSQNFAELTPRLAAIEKSLLVNHDAMLDAARAAAEDVLRTAQFAPAGSIENEAAVQLASDLRSLDILARKSDERNTKTFEAIHDTLLKIVDRLNTVEMAKVPVRQEFPAFVEPKPVALMPEAKLDLGFTAPSFDAADLANERYDDEIYSGGARGQQPLRSPAEAAAAAASAASEVDIEVRDGAREAEKGSLFSGLTKVFRRQEKPSDIQLAGMTAPKSEPVLDDLPLIAAVGGAIVAAGTAIAGGNNPIEPGATTPDLNTIMKRVRDERRTKTDGSDDTSKSDFLAAARRAAQAAAADSDILKKRSDVSNAAGKGGLIELFNKQRKPILMVALAAMVALTVFQMRNAFLPSAEPTTVESAVAQPAPLNDTAKPEKITTTDELGAPAPETTVRAAAPVDSAKAEAPVAADAVPAEPDAPMAADAMTTSAPTVAVPKAQAEATPDVAATPSSTPSSNLPSADIGPIALREAAANSDTKALFEIASRYTDGRGVTKDLKTAAQWYQKAADKGFAPAQFRLGSFYEKGLGVERSAAKAKELYQLSADQGNASAMHNLAVLFASGAAGPADNDSAAKWFVKAAELGVSDSQYNLGILAAKGLGVPQSLEESYKWFALTAKSGDKDAASKRDEIANVMRPEQLKKARATTELWKAKPVVAAANVVDIPEEWKTDGGTTANVDMKKAIRNIQAILNQNGYDAGAPDGSMGDKTKKAISAYQKANGMPSTGEVDEALVKSLLAKVKK